MPISQLVSNLQKFIDALDSDIDKQKAFSAFGSWIEGYRKDSKIMTNDLLLQ